VHVDLDGLARRLPLGPAVGEVANQLGVDAHDRLPGGQMRACLLVGVAELAVAVWVLGASSVLGVRCSV
jgi:hypothetical protein